MRNRAKIIFIFAALMILGGIISMFAVDWWTGFYLMVMGLFLVFLQALDSRRGIRAQRHVCPRCGLMIPKGTRLCTNCGYRIE